MEKRYKLLNFVNEDFTDKTAIENYDGIVYDQALDIVFDILNSENFEIDEKNNFILKYSMPGIKNNNTNSCNMYYQKNEISDYLLDNINNILNSLGIDNAFRIDASVICVKIPASDVSKVVKNYYNLSQSIEYQAKTIKGEYKYDSKLNKAANKILVDLYDICDTQNSRLSIIYDNDKHRINLEVYNSWNRIHKSKIMDIELTLEEYKIVFELLKFKINMYAKDYDIKYSLDYGTFINIESNDKVFLRTKSDYEKNKLIHVLK